MDYTNLGTSGLKVSRIALGCMSFGTPRDVMPWTLGEDAAQPIFRQALDLGISFWDTANVYGAGTSEEIVGRAIKQLTTREAIVLATKLYWPMHAGPGGSGLSRKAILEQVDASLRRLGTDYIDLLQIHRYDADVPVEETMEALHDVVKAGKARYLGASSMWAWRLAKMQHAAERHRWTKFISMQDQYSLLPAKRIARCSACSPTKASAPSRGVPSPPASSPAHGRARLSPLAGQPVRRHVRSTPVARQRQSDRRRRRPHRARARRLHGDRRHGVGAQAAARLNTLKAPPGRRRIRRAGTHAASWGWCTIASALSRPISAPMSTSTSTTCIATPALSTELSTSVPVSR